MIKRWHKKDHVLNHEGKRWTVDIAAWEDLDGKSGQLRVYRVEGDVTTPLLKEALEAEAAAEGLRLTMTFENRQTS